MPYAELQEPIFFGKHYHVDDDLDLCHMLQTMKLDGLGKTADNIVIPNIQPTVEAEVVMVEDRLGRSLVPPDTATEDPLREGSKKQEALPCGCAYLRAIRHQLEWDAYPTTGGEYLDAIFTHREILFSQPTAHQDCAQAFSDLAGVLEKRAWRSDRDDDSEAVVAFRHEAWVVASTLPPPMRPANSICVLMPMM